MISGGTTMGLYRFLAVLLLSFATVGVSHGQRTKTVTVIGAVLYPGGKPAAGIPVGLYCTADKGCLTTRVLAQTRITPEGIYAMIEAGVSLDKLYVLYEGSDASLTADYIEVELDCDGTDPCLVFANDLLLKSLPQVGQAAPTAEFIDAVARANDVKVAAKVLSKEAAAKQTADKAAYAIGMTSPATGQGAYVDQVLENLKKTAKSPLTTKAINKQVIISHPDYLKTKDIRIEPGDLLKPKSLGPDKLQKLMILPSDAVKKEWVDPGILKKLVEQHGDRSEVSLGVTTPSGSLRPIARVPGQPAEKDVAKIIAEHPDIRAWAVFDTLAKEKQLSPAQKAVLEQRTKSARPVVIHAKTK
jgi:hypothetical protein